MNEDVQALDPHCPIRLDRVDESYSFGTVDYCFHGWMLGASTHFRAR